MSSSIPLAPQSQPQTMTRAEFKAQFGREPEIVPNTSYDNPWKQGLTRAQFKEIFGRDPNVLSLEEYDAYQKKLSEGTQYNLLDQAGRDASYWSQNPFLTTPILGPAVAGLGMAGGRIRALGESIIPGGEDKTGELVDRFSQAIPQVQPGFIAETVRGVAQTVPTMTTGAGVTMATGNPAAGLATMIGMSGAQAMNDAYRETKDPHYAWRAGVIEAGITALFQGMGKGGLEAAATRGFKEGFKGFAKVFGEEVPEELSILFFDNLNRVISGYDPERALDAKTVSKDFYDMAQVAAQTALMAGLGSAGANMRRKPPQPQAPAPLQLEYQRKIGLDEPSRYPAIPIEPTSGPPIPLGRPQPQQTAYAPDVETAQGIQGLGGADLSRFQPRQFVEGIQGAGPMVETPEILNYPQFGYWNVLPSVPTYAPQVAPEMGVMGFGVGESVPKPIPRGPQDTSGAGPYGVPEIPASPMEAPIRQTPKKLQRFESIFDAAAQQTEGAVPPELLMAVAQVESAGNPKATSPAGAKGMMQLMDGTAKELGVTDPFDPQQAIPAAARYIAQGLQRHGGDLDLALADYNAGPGNVDKYGGVPPFKETQEYIRKVRSAMAGIQGDNETAALLKVPTEALQALTDMRAEKGKPLTAQEVRNVIGEGDKESAKPIRDWVNREVSALTALGTEASVPTRGGRGQTAIPGMEDAAMFEEQVDQLTPSFGSREAAAQFVTDVKKTKKFKDTEQGVEGDGILFGVGETVEDSMPLPKPAMDFIRQERMRREAQQRAQRTPKERQTPPQSRLGEVQVDPSGVVEQLGQTRNIIPSAPEDAALRPRIQEFTTRKRNKLLQLDFERDPLKADLIRAEISDIDNEVGLMKVGLKYGGETAGGKKQIVVDPENITRAKAFVADLRSRVETMRTEMQGQQLSNTEISKRNQNIRAVEADAKRFERQIAKAEQPKGGESYGMRQEARQGQGEVTPAPQAGGGEVSPPAPAQQSGQEVSVQSQITIPDNPSKRQQSIIDNLNSEDTGKRLGAEYLLARVENPKPGYGPMDTSRREQLVNYLEQRAAELGYPKNDDAIMDATVALTDDRYAIPGSDAAIHSGYQMAAKRDPKLAAHMAGDPSLEVKLNERLVVARKAGVMVGVGGDNQIVEDTDTAALAKEMPDSTVIIKDTNGHRASMRMDTFHRMSQQPGFTDRIRQARFLPGAEPENVSTGFMNGIFDKNQVSGPQPEALPMPEEVSGLNIKNNATVRNDRHVLFNNALAENAALLKKLGVENVSIESPHTMDLSEQGHITRDRKTIRLNADATNPSGTIRHEIGHVVSQRLSDQDKASLMRDAKEGKLSGLYGYASLGDADEVAAQAFADGHVKFENGRAYYDRPTPPPLVREMVSAGQKSVAELRSRISDVKLGAIEAGKETFTFKLDGNEYKGTLQGRNQDLVLGMGADFDAGIAARVLLDKQASPITTARKSTPSPQATVPTLEPLTFRRVKVGNKTAYDTTVSGRNITIDRTAAQEGLPFEVRVEGQSAPVDFFRTLGEAKDYVSNTLRQEMEADFQADVEVVDVEENLPQPTQQPEIVKATKKESQIVSNKSSQEKISKYGFTPSQTNYLSQELTQWAKSDPESPVTIQVPGDGKVTAATPEAASAIVKRISGKPIDGIEPFKMPKVFKPAPVVNMEDEPRFKIGKAYKLPFMSDVDTLIERQKTMAEQEKKFYEGGAAQQPPARTQTLQTAAQNLAAIEGKAEPVVSEGQAKAFDKLVEKPQTAAPRPIWKLPFKQYAKERIASEGIKNPADVAEREQDLRRTHRRAVQDAIAAGEKVPVANVKEYGGEKPQSVAAPAPQKVDTPTDWQITKRSGETAVAWQRGDVTITKENRKPAGKTGGGIRYVVRGHGDTEYGATTLEKAQEFADTPQVQQVSDVQAEGIRVAQKLVQKYFKNPLVDPLGFREHWVNLDDPTRKVVLKELNSRGLTSPELLNRKTRPVIASEVLESLRSNVDKAQKEFERNPLNKYEDFKKSERYAKMLGVTSDTTKATAPTQPLFDLRNQANEEGISLVEKKKRSDRTRAKFDELYPGSGGKAFSDFMRTGNPPKSSKSTLVANKPAPDPATMTARAINEEIKQLDALSQEIGNKLIEADRGMERASETMKKDDPLSKQFQSNFKRQQELRSEAELRIGWNSGSYELDPKNKKHAARKKRGSDPTNPQSGVVNLSAPRAVLDALYDFGFKQFVAEFTPSRPMAKEEAAAFDAARIAQMGISNRAGLQKKKLVKSQAAALRAAFSNRADQRVVRDAIDGLKDGRYRVETAPQGMTTAQMLQSARDAMRGKSPSVFLPERLAKSVIAQREFLDAASRAILDNGSVTTKGQVAAVKRGIGLWVRRSYEVHDNPNWVSQVQKMPAWKTAIDEMQAEWNEATKTPEALTDLELVQFARRHLPGVKNAKALNKIEEALGANPDPETLDPKVRAEVEAALRALPERSRAEFSNRLTAILSEMSNEGREGVLSNRLGSQNRTSLMRRKTIPKWLRDVMGEYTDPEINFARSADIQAQMMGAWEFSKSLYEAGKGKFIFDDIASVPQAMRKAFDIGEFVQLPDNPKYGMLAGKFVSKEMRAAMDQTRPEMSDVAKLLSQISGTVRWMKTIGNVYTGGGIRNLVSSGFAAVGRGDLPVASVYKMTQKLRSGKSFEQAAAEMLGIPKEKLKEHHEEMVRRGVHDTEISMNLTRERLQNSLWGKKDFDPNNPHPFRNFKEFSENLWLFGDNFWKSLSVIENTARYQDYAKKQGWTQQQLEKHVDNIVRNTSPTYDAAFPVVNKLKNDILNVVWQDFITWPAERIRNKANLIKLIGYELQSKDPKLVASGSLRLASMLGSHALMTIGLSTAGQWMLGSDDDELDWALRELMPEWMRYAPVWYQGGKNEDGTYSVADLGYSDADSMMNKVALAAIEGNFDEAGMELVKTFFGASIAFDTFEQIRMNRKESGEPIWLQADKFHEAAYKATRFATIKAGPPIAAMAWQGYERYMGKKEEVGARSMQDRLWSTTGFSNYTINPENSFSYKAKAAAGQFRDIRSTISRTAKEYPNQNIRDIEEANAVKRNKAAAELVEYGVASRVAGLDPGKIRKQLKEASIRQDYIVAIMGAIERSYNTLKETGVKDFSVKLRAGDKPSKRREAY
jgi:hypothetical protein